MVNVQENQTGLRPSVFFSKFESFFWFLCVHFSFQLSVGFVLILKRLVVAIFGYCSRSAALPQWLSLLSFRFSVKDKDKGLILQ